MYFFGNQYQLKWKMTIFRHIIAKSQKGHTFGHTFAKSTDDETKFYYSKTVAYSQNMGELVL
jgi:hypothetical protein